MLLAASFVTPLSATSHKPAASVPFRGPVICFLPMVWKTTSPASVSSSSESRISLPLHKESVSLGFEVNERFLLAARVHE